MGTPAPTMVATTVATPALTASATATSGRGLLTPSPRLSPRLMPMPLFCTEAMATATLPPTPMAATATPPPTPTAHTPAPTTMVPAPTATTGNLPNPHYVHIRGHHVRAGCLGVGI